jgi:membrane protein implicated in regulation of membrane protease activity
MKEEKSSKRNLIDIIVLSLSVVFLIIGIHQTITVGFGQAYWLFMLSIAFLLYQQIRKARKKQEENQPKLNRRAKRYMDRNG